MEGAVEISMDAAEAIRKIRSAPPAVVAAFLGGLRSSLLLVEDDVRRGSALKWRRGSAGLAGRLTSYAKMDGLGDVDAAIGFRKRRGFPYELAQEFGAKAKAGGAIAIPLSAMAKRASEQGRGPRELGVPLRVAKINGKAFLVANLSRAGRAAGVRVMIHYIFVKAIKPRLGFMAAMRRSIPKLSNDVVDAARRAWRSI